MDALRLALNRGFAARFGECRRGGRGLGSLHGQRRRASSKGIGFFMEAFRGENGTSGRNRTRIGFGQDELGRFSRRESVEVEVLRLLVGECREELGVEVFLVHVIKGGLRGTTFGGSSQLGSHG